MTLYLQKSRNYFKIIKKIRKHWNQVFQINVYFNNIHPNPQSTVPVAPSSTVNTAVNDQPRALLLRDSDRFPEDRRDDVERKTQEGGGANTPPPNIDGALIVDRHQSTFPDGN